MMSLMMMYLGMATLQTVAQKIINILYIAVF